MNTASTTATRPSILCAKCEEPTTHPDDSRKHFARCETHGDLTIWEVLGA